MDELHARVDLQGPLQARRDSRLEQAPDLDLAPSGQQLDLRAAERVRADRDEEELVSVEDGADRSYRQHEGAEPRESTDATSQEAVVTHRVRPRAAPERGKHAQGGQQQQEWPGNVEACDEHPIQDARPQGEPLDV